MDGGVKVAEAVEVASMALGDRGGVLLSVCEDVRLPREAVRLRLGDDEA